MSLNTIYHTKKTVIDADSSTDSTEPKHGQPIGEALHIELFEEQRKVERLEYPLSVIPMGYMQAVETFLENHEQINLTIEEHYTITKPKARNKKSKDEDDATYRPEGTFIGKKASTDE